MVRQGGIPLPDHPIGGVATSIAAFIGWSNQGPVDQAVMVQSWADFQAQFGDLSTANGIPNYLGYSVSQFFGNGGQQAYVIRLAGPDAATASAPSVLGDWAIYARNPGAWGNQVWVNIVPAAAAGRFSLQVFYSPDGTPAHATEVESFANLSTAPADPLFVGTVVNSGSKYVTLANPANPAPPLGPFSGTVAATPSTAAPAGIRLAGGGDGTPLVPADGKFETALGADASPTSTASSGSRLLDRVAIFNLLCVPGETDAPTLAVLQGYCSLKRAFLVIDCPPTATTANLTTSGAVGTNDTGGLLCGESAMNSAYYYPWVEAPDPLFANRPTLFPPCGFVAGVYVATDTNRGIWTAPSGVAAPLAGVTGLQYALTDPENDSLNVKAINCLRQFAAAGEVVWGARTLQGSDQAGSQWKYIPVRRLALFIESSLQAGTAWAAFEPNAEPVWNRIQLDVSAFLQGLYLKGAFQGTTPQQAYYVKCDGETNPPASIGQGVVTVVVGFAPVAPAEFIVLQIQQFTARS